MFGFREQAVSLYCQSKHLQLQITTSFAVYKACYARIRCKDALHTDKRGQCHYPAFVNSVTVLKTLVQYLPSSKMSNACHFVNLDASVTRKTVLSRQQVSFNSQGLASKEVSAIELQSYLQEKSVEILSRLSPGYNKQGSLCWDTSKLSVAAVRSGRQALLFFQTKISRGI